jgi:hypothetical protein
MTVLLCLCVEKATASKYRTEDVRLVLDKALKVLKLFCQLINSIALGFAPGFQSSLIFPRGRWKKLRERPRLVRGSCGRERR